MNFRFLITEIEQITKKVPPVRRLSTQQRARLSQDLALVGSSLRTGCLIDTFSPKNPVFDFSSVLEILREEPSTEHLFEDVVHIFEPTSEQSFFANISCLRQRMARTRRQCLIEPISTDGQDYLQQLTITFVGLLPGSGYEMIPDEEIPSEFWGVFESLLTIRSAGNKTLPLSITLEENLPLEITVPLAAFILDYPVAYVPKSPQGISTPVFLSGVTVRTYECILANSEGSTSGRKAHGGLGEGPISVMKFSCPTGLEEGYPERLLPRVIIQGLENLFEARLKKVRGGSEVMTVVSESVTFDRLAL